MKIIGVGLSLLALCGCAVLERSMAGKIGCPHEEIQILDKSPGWGVASTTLTGECRGQKFVCTVNPRGDFEDMSCAPIVSRSRSKYSEEGSELSSPRAKNFDGFVEELNEKAEAIAE
jgi:hypothetical protein